jgi:hypothetical protein
MPIDYHKPGAVIDDPRSEPRPPPPKPDAMPGFPLALQSEIFIFEGIFRVPNPQPVGKRRALDLARRVLDYPERERVSLVAALFYRLAKRGA